MKFIAQFKEEHRRSIWLDGLEKRYPPLKGEHRAQVVVVGGGITGLTTALLLREAGFTVALLEAKQIVTGVTGYTTAKLTVAHDLIYSRLRRELGEKMTQLYANANLTALNWVKETVRTHRIDCDLETAPALVYATTDAERELLLIEQAAAAAAGLEAAYVPDTQTDFAPHGALYYADQAHFHPRKYLLSLARLYTAAGGEIYEQTRVEAVEEKGSQVIVRTTGGAQVTAEHAVISSHFPIYDPALYYARLTPHRSYALAAEITDEIPSEMYIGIGDRGHSLRPQRSGDNTYLIVSGAGHRAGQGADTVARYRQLYEWTDSRFCVTSSAYFWSTQDNRTPDGVPYIGQISPRSERVWLATGYGGWGMTNGTAAAMLLTDLIQGKNNVWQELYDPNRPVPTWAFTRQAETEAAPLQDDSALPERPLTVQYEPI